MKSRVSLVGMEKKGICIWWLQKQQALDTQCSSSWLTSHVWLCCTSPGHGACCVAAMVHGDGATGCMGWVKPEGPRSSKSPYRMGCGCWENARKRVSWELLVWLSNAPPPSLYNLLLHTVSAVEQFSTKRNQTLIWIWQPPEPSCEEKSYYSSEWHNRPSWYTFLIEHDWVRHDTLIDMWFYGRGKWWWVWGWRCGSYMGARWISGGA